ncbi:hypothetical protein ACOGYG_002601 [Edwardsiella piscicida]|uniref:hypothetical protein n=1 Tax=Edwardsiella piscicida TaxID=1263550 RepID=UPI0011819554|nr:hypothetical protein [Edwardsiella piscicida]EKS7779993.1 hypothetical protein [Edwardsiella piscicida]
MSKGAEFWVGQLRQQLDPHHNSGRKAWETMTPEQRGLVLHAAGLSPVLCRYDWGDIGADDLRRLFRGIQRLKALIGRFDTVRQDEFIAHEQRCTVMPVKYRRPGLQSKVQLLSSISK